MTNLGDLLSLLRSYRKRRHPPHRRKSSSNAQAAFISMRTALHAHTASGLPVMQIITVPLRKGTNDRRKGGSYMNYNANFFIPETVIQRCRLFVDMDGTLVVWKHAKNVEQLLEEGYFRTM